VSSALGERATTPGTTVRITSQGPESSATWCLHSSEPFHRSPLDRVGTANDDAKRLDGKTIEDVVEKAALERREVETALE
jgi:hypothetical protein